MAARSRFYFIFTFYYHFNPPSEGTWLPPKTKNILNTPTLLGVGNGGNPSIAFFLKQPRVIKSILLTVYLGNTWNLENVTRNLVAEKFKLKYDYYDIYNPGNHDVNIGDISLRNTWEACDTRKCKNMTVCTYCEKRVLGKQLLEIMFNDEEPVFTSTVTVGYSGRTFNVIDYSFRTGLSISKIFLLKYFCTGKSKRGGERGIPRPKVDGGPGTL